LKKFIVFVKILRVKKFTTFFVLGGKFLEKIISNY